MTKLYQSIAAVMQDCKGRVYFHDMANETAPLKRSLQLTALSRGHHFGSSTTVDTLKEFVKCYWKNHFREHFDQEEQMLLPYNDSVAGR